MSELKRCPFCGQEVKIEETQPDMNLVECLRNSHIEYYIECSCGSGMIDEDKEELIERWNTRIETMDRLVRDVEKWAYDKGLDKANPRDQYLKVAEECGEIAAGLARGNEDAVKDAIGDTVVTLIILAQQMGLTLEECLQVAWDEIKDRTGEMRDGVFVKSEDFIGGGGVNDETH